MTKGHLNFTESGVEVSPHFIDDVVINQLRVDIQKLGNTTPLHGIRNVDKKISSIHRLVHSKQFLQKAQQYLSGIPQVVRVIVFDKTPQKNWLVSWHQDKTIAINKRATIDNWGPWSVKDNVHHVQPDLAVLNSMVTFRIHLDSADKHNGCLKVIPQSHKLGILSQAVIDDLVACAKVKYCKAQAGDLLVMRPLLVHASAKAKTPHHRRVIHIEYSDYQLPNGLQWAV